MAAPFEPRFPSYIDSTMRACFASCHQKFYLQYIRRISPTAKSPDLHAGAAFAAAMEATRSALYADYVVHPPKVSTAVEAGIAAMMTYWGDYEPPDDFRGNPHIKSFTNMATAFLDYWQHYHPSADDLIPYMNADGTPAIEYTFAIPLPIMHPESSEPLIYCGRFDMLGYYRNYPDALYVVDEKTTSRLGPKWASKWSMRGQFIGYKWAVTQAQLQPETAQCVGAIVRGVGILKNEITHAQAIITIPNWQVDRWYDQLLRDAELMVHLWREGQLPGRTDGSTWDFSYADACESYNGCPMMELCTSHNLEPWLSDYEERMWNPLQRNPVAILESIA